MSIRSALADVGRALVWRAIHPAIRQNLTTINPTNSFWGYVRESFAGAWQTGVVVNRDETLSNFAVFACINLIAQDIAKMRPKLMYQNRDVWVETTASAFSPLLRKPNHFQTRIKFFEQWITSKLVHGNTYVLKRYNARGTVDALYILDPTRVTVLLSDSGDVFYQMQTDHLSGLHETQVTVPARAIIHDVGATLFHPLLGVSPLFACSLSATQGIKIQQNSSKFFSNMSRPSGLLTAPGAISDATAARLKTAWETNYGGDNVGKVAVLGDGLKYESMSVNPVDAQLVEQLRMTAEIVCSVYHVPPYMIGIGTMPTYNNIEALNQQYYSQALQSPIENLELLLDEGLGLEASGYGVEFDIDGLLRMDTATRYKGYSDAIGGGWMHPNFARTREGLLPVSGGDTPYLQQQNYSLAALNKRDTKEDPFLTSKPAPDPTTPAPPANNQDPTTEQAMLALAEMVQRGLHREAA